MVIVFCFFGFFGLMLMQGRVTYLSCISISWWLEEAFPGRWPGKIRGVLHVSCEL